MGFVAFVKLPLTDVDVHSPSIKSFLGIIRNISEKGIDIDHLKVIFKGQAWLEFPTIFNPSGNPSFLLR